MTEQIRWQKSTFSGEGASCVEIAISDDALHIRESDQPHETITTTPVKLAAFIKGIKAGEFDHFADL
jgi:hypothetical protein